MNQQDLHVAVAEHLNISAAEAKRVVKGVFHVIQETVAAGEKVVVTGFGHWEAKVREARTARNPATGESVDVAERAVPVFRAGTTFKSTVAGK